MSSIAPYNAHSEKLMLNFYTLKLDSYVAFNYFAWASINSTRMKVPHLQKKNFSVVTVGLRMMINRRQQQKRRKEKMEEREGSKKEVHQVVLPLFRMSLEEERKTRVRMKPCRWTLQLSMTVMLPRRLGQLLRRAAVKTVTREMIHFHILL